MYRISKPDTVEGICFWLSFWSDGIDLPPAVAQPLITLISIVLKLNKEYILFSNNFYLRHEVDFSCEDALKLQF
jgi:hypothetical protein